MPRSPSRRSRTPISPASIALWQRCGLTRPWNDPAADIALARKGANATVLIGRDGGAIVATAMVGHDGHRGWVYYVATDPEHRGKGHGRAIMQAAEDWLRAAGIAKLQLMVRPRQRQGRRRSTSRSAMASSSAHLRQMARRPRTDAVAESQPHDHLRPHPRQGRPRPLRSITTALKKHRRSTTAAATANGRRKRARAYDRGNAATLLPFNLARRTVVLVRQFRHAGLCQRR